MSGNATTPVESNGPPGFGWLPFRGALRAAVLLAVLVMLHARGGAAELDLSRLPPPATNRIEFTRDIKPILEAHCLKCHGPVKPKSGFRVDDREALLRGGEGGTNVVAGRSEQSTLIHYVAHLVEDMEMPPPGKGERLTPEQIGLLRAWIDQGVAWDPAEAPPRREFSLSPGFRWLTVEGNEGRFREHRWFKEGARSGVEEFSFTERLPSGAQQTLEGRVWAEDYRVKLMVEKPELGFLRAGWEQNTHYYDDTGGYYQPFTPSAFRLDRDVALDVGRFWTEVGLRTPGAPEAVLGYEYLYKDGDKSILQWLPESQVVNATTTTRHIYPNAKRIDERTHVVRLDLEHNLAGTRLTDNFRYEFHDAASHRGGVPPESTRRNELVNIREGYQARNWMNAARLERQVKDWLLTSAGYLYTASDGEAAVRLNTVDAAGQPIAGYYWRANEIVLNQSSHTANLNAQLGPWQHFVVAAGVQTEWAHQEGFGDALLDNGDDADPTTGVPAVVSANHDRFSAEQNVVARFTGIQRTVLFAETRLRQETIGQFEQEQGGVGDEFLRATDALNRWQEYRAGFQTSPWRPVSLSSHYKRRYRDSEYDHDRDVNPATPVGNGYSAFILSRDTSLDEIEARVTWHALAWLKSSLTYRVTASDYRTETASAVVFPARLAPPGGRLLSGNHDAHYLALNATLTPVARLYLSATLSWQNSRIVTQETNNPAVAPYKGDVYSILTTATYALNPKTDLLASYVFSHADYGQDNDAFGLPLGAVYHSHGLQAGLSRQVTKQVKLNLQYGWYRYDESSTGGWADYAAHGLFAVVNVRWP